MDCMNRIELRGRVGSSGVIAVGGTAVAHVALCTSHVLKDASGRPEIETTWHNVTVWRDRMRGRLEDIGKGSVLRVAGRLRGHTYIGSDGLERRSYEVVADEAELVGG